MHLLYQKTAKNAVAIRFVNYSVDIIYDLLLELMDQTEKQEQIMSTPCFENFMSVIENLTVVS